MRYKFFGIFILIALIAGYGLVFPAFEKARAGIKNIQTKGLTFPPVVVKLLALEFRSIAADYLFSRASQFMGGKMEKREPVNKGDMVWLYSNLYVISELDPYFEDTYYMGNAFLTWEVGMFNEANKLLQRATDARTWDWQFPFFLGFNKFYFLNDSKGGADSLMIAAKRPGAHPFLPTLAARLYSRAGRTETAIGFLITFWENEKDPRNKKSIELRIDALKRILFLENAVAKYKKKMRRLPGSLDMLVRSGIIEAIPKDPYGGVFYIDKDDSIQTTSKLAFANKMQKQPNK